MRYSGVFIESLGYQLAPEILTTEAVEERLAPVYAALGIPPGQIEALTGVRERRQWAEGTPLWEGAARAGRKALETAGFDPSDIGMVIYGGVCRDNLEPATACAVADALGIGGGCQVLDVSNACLGVMNGMLLAADGIELGHVRAALVVSCETSRQIVDLTIERMRANPTMEVFRHALATMTGGSGAAAVVLAGRDAARGGHRLVGGAIRTAPQFHKLCRWGPDTGMPATAPMVMETDAPSVLQNGVALGVETWRDFLAATGWTPTAIDRIICHQVGEGHRLAILNTLGIPEDKDFSTFPFLGNIGTVSLPMTAAIAEERGVIEPGHRVGFLGIGSGLNCLMLGVEW